ncbi:hypothetical protein Ancab_010215 [Ancistrocladus abbreviatus]
MRKHPGTVSHCYQPKRRVVEVVEATDLIAEVLDVDVWGSEEEVEAALLGDGERFGGSGDGGFQDGLEGQAGEGFSVGVEAVVLFGTEGNGAGYVCPRLVGVEADGVPPAGYGRFWGGMGRDGGDEFADYPFLGYMAREDWTHVVFEVDEFRGAFEFFRWAEEIISGIVGVEGGGCTVGPWAPGDCGGGAEEEEDSEEGQWSEDRRNGRFRGGGEVRHGSGE